MHRKWLAKVYYPRYLYIVVTAYGEGRAIDIAIYDDVEIVGGRWLGILKYLWVGASNIKEEAQKKAEQNDS